MTSKGSQQGGGGSHQPVDVFFLPAGMCCVDVVVRFFETGDFLVFFLE